MAKPTTHQVVSGDTLYSLAKKYSTTVDKLKSINGLKSDIIKIGQILKVSDTTTLSAPSRNWIIAKSENYLGKLDSYNSKGKKLPAKFFTRNGTLYTLGKEKLADELIDLAKETSMFTAEEFTTYLVKQFLTNKIYSLNNTYTHPKLVEEVRKSDSFQKYVQGISLRIKNELLKNKGYLANPSEPLVKNYERFHFKDEATALFMTGLGFAINQVSYVEVEVNDVIYKNGNPSKLKTTFIIYDTFGLDDADIEKYGGLDMTTKEGMDTHLKRSVFQRVISSEFGWRFNCWWALQFYHNCVPLLVKLRVDNVEIAL